MADNKQHEFYASLDRLSTEQLEELLRADLSSPDQNNEELIFYILEVMEQREREQPTGRLPDAHEAWAEFKEYYDIPEGEGQSLYPSPTNAQPPEQPAVVRPAVRRRPRKVVLIAAVLATLLAGMITAQASGCDILSAIGRWTEETFHFSTGNTASQEEDLKAFREAAAACEIPESLVPSRVLSGFNLDDLEIDTFDDLVNSVFASFYDPENERVYSITIEYYFSKEYLESLVIEKDNSQIVLYNSNGKAFHVMSNLGDLVAAWSDGTYVVTVVGEINERELKEILDSIGESK